MSFLLTMDIFSGRENPSWVVSDKLASELLERFRASEKQLLDAPPSPILGYRGIRVAPIERQEEKPESLLKGEQDEGAVYVSGVPELEEFLISTGREILAAPIIEHALDILRRPDFRLPELAPAVKCPVCVAKDAPAYNPGFWNTPARQPHNNCYNYANNQATNTFAQPGRATGKPITGLSCKGVQPSAQGDGLKPAAGFNAPLAAGQGWYVALVIWPGVDYHWYRQDDVGCWSHKPGQTAARDVDNSGNKITDPKTCNRGNYTDFCTYMVTGKWVKIA